MLRTDQRGQTTVELALLLGAFVFLPVLFSAIVIAALHSADGLIASDPEPPASTVEYTEAPYVIGYCESERYTICEVHAPPQPRLPLDPS